jgi:predicted nucleotide-binding protein (sugar kinase/HSP70/actin superfamily)
VLHPGTIEFFHYRCPVITFESELIQNENSITDLDQLSSALNYPVYNVVNSGVKRFVYEHGEIDQFYNEEFIRVRQN